MTDMKFKMTRAMNLFYVQPWSERILQHQWQYFCHICSRDINYIDLLAYQWYPPSICKDYADSDLNMPHRKRGRLKFKWDEYIRKFCKYRFGIYDDEFIAQMTQWSHTLPFYETEFVKFHTYWHQYQ